MNVEVIDVDRMYALYRLGADFDEIGVIVGLDKNFVREILRDKYDQMIDSLRCIHRRKARRKVLRKRYEKGVPPSAIAEELGATVDIILCFTGEPKSSTRSLFGMRRKDLLAAHGEWPFSG